MDFTFDQNRRAARPICILRPPYCFTYGAQTALLQAEKMLYNQVSIVFLVLSAQAFSNKNIEKFEQICIITTQENTFLRLGLLCSKGKIIMPYLNKKIFTKPVFLAVMAGLALIAMPISSYSAVDMYLKIEGIEGESSSAKPSEMRATDETTVAAVIAYVARLAGTDRSKVSLTWKGRPLNAKKTLGSYHMKGRITIKAKIDKSTPLRGTSEKY